MLQGIRRKSSLSLFRFPRDQSIAGCRGRQKVNSTVIPSHVYVLAICSRDHSKLPPLVFDMTSQPGNFAACVCHGAPPSLGGPDTRILARKYVGPDVGVAVRPSVTTLESQASA